ncbi:MAG: Spy/CpxP family protein refolding chaperone [Pseudoflavonifractor sp.]|nr:Spy/CpxP family protein refolding chaperone [Alloprevotella sp.]MCM1117495.1 Spy/CpxP family protein refolding chaperone [Pseudoflavonifractor sp.]
MKKRFLSLAIAALAFSSLSSFGQSAGDSTSDKSQATPGCAQAYGDKGQKRAPCPFDGLNLNADQKAQLEALNAERQKSREEARKGALESRKAERERSRATREKARESRKAERRAYLDKVKAILTPEQYVTWLENMAVNQDMKAPANRRGKMKASKPRKERRNVGKPCKECREAAKKSAG